MALDEHTRHSLHLRLDELVGHELATKQDLEILEHRLTASLHDVLNARTKTVVFSTIGTIGGLLGGAAAISNLFG